MTSRRRVSAHEKRIVGARSGWKCEQCNSILDETYECDHKIPLWKGGGDTIDDLQALCVSCHKKKTLVEEVERLKITQNLRRSKHGKPPLQCFICQKIVSQYFTHVCDEAC